LGRPVLTLPPDYPRPRIDEADYFCNEFLTQDTRGEPKEVRVHRAFRSPIGDSPKSGSGAIGSMAIGTTKSSLELFPYNQVISRHFPSPWSSSFF
jgi:hypothetical protein